MNPARGTRSNIRLSSEGRLIALSLAALLALSLAAGCGETASDLFTRGGEAFEQGRYDEAVKLYKEGIEKEPDSSVGYNLLGMAYRFKFNQTGIHRMKQEEIDAFKKAIELDPRNYVALVNLGVTLYYAGQKKDAAAYLQKALEIYPQHPDRARLEQMIKEGQQ